MSQVHFWWFPETFEFSKNLVFYILKSRKRWLGMEQLALLRSECFGTDRTVPVGCLRNCWECFTSKRSEQLREDIIWKVEHQRNFCRLSYLDNAIELTFHIISTLRLLRDEKNTTKQSYLFLLSQVKHSYLFRTNQSGANSSVPLWWSSVPDKWIN